MVHVGGMQVSTQQRVLDMTWNGVQHPSVHGRTATEKKKNLRICRLSRPLPSKERSENQENKEKGKTNRLWEPLSTKCQELQGQGEGEKLKTGE